MILLTIRLDKALYISGTLSLPFPQLLVRTMAATAGAAQNLTVLQPDFTVEIERPGFQYMTETCQGGSEQDYENQILEHRSGAVSAGAVWHGDVLVRPAK